MSDNNIVNFAAFADKVKARVVADEAPRVLQEYDLPPTKLLMETSLQIQLLKDIALSKLGEDLSGAPKIHRMLTMLEYLFDGIVHRAVSLSSIAVRERVKEPHSCRYSVYAFGSSSNKLTACQKGRPAPDIAYGICIQNIDLGNDIVADAECTVVPDTSMRYEIQSCSSVSEQQVRHFVRRMNNMVEINGGFGRLMDGIYIVFIPFGGGVYTAVTLELGNPITVLENDVDRENDTIADDEYASDCALAIERKRTLSESNLIGFDEMLEKFS
jgi:hypothetical protein